MDELLELLTAKLTAQGVDGRTPLADNTLPSAIASAIIDCCLTWLPKPNEVIKLQEPRPVTAIIGFAFGNRFELHGNRGPGPVNELLADLVNRYFTVLAESTIPPRVWVQWEIGTYIPSGKVPGIISLEPQPNIEKDEVAYISTDKVMEVVKQQLTPSDEVSILVVAQPHHLRRCMKVARKYGFDHVFAVHHSDPNAADWYDPQSGQLWTRSRHLYLLHDMLGQLRMHREAMNVVAKSKGIWE